MVLKQPLDAIERERPRVPRAPRTVCARSSELTIASSVGSAEAWKRGSSASSAIGDWRDVVKAITKSAEPWSITLYARPRPTSVLRPMRTS